MSPINICNLRRRPQPIAAECAEGQPSSVSSEQFEAEQQQQEQGRTITEDASMRDRKFIKDKFRYVIFPQNKWIKIWDGLIVVLLFAVAFTIPYQIGVSGGYYLNEVLWWMVVNIVVDFVFIVDTLLYFWRAYRGIDGRLVFNLRKIRKRYIQTFFFFNLLGNFPANLLFVANNYTEEDQNYEAGWGVLLKVLDLLKLFRLLRLVYLFSSSEMINNFKQRRKYQATFELVKYSFLLIVVSHWFACLWSFLVLVQTGTFSKQLLNDANWITLWHDSYFNEGTINPVGWTQDVDRYILSMFWAIQTITSIGYGNIYPYTAVEWWMSCIMMLAAGVLWAYIIGGLVGVAASFNERDDIYRNRIDEANRMIKNFATSGLTDDDCDNCEVNDIKVFGKRIKEFIEKQRMYSVNATSVNDVGQTFPVIETLSPELQLLSSFMLLREQLELVPYLSSRFLNMDERSMVARECLLLNFASGEKLPINDSLHNIGRGIFVFYSGSAFINRELIGDFKERRSKAFLITSGSIHGEDQVLLEDDAYGAAGLIRFVTFSKILFIPRKAVLAALDRNPKAWKDCARWKYLMAALRSSENKRIISERLLKTSRNTTSGQT